MIFLSKRQDIDYAENKKEQVRLLSNFPANPLFLALATGANMLKQEIARPTTKNWVRQALNQPSSANFNQLAIFCTPTHAYCTKSPTATPKRIAIVSCIKTTTHPCCITVDDIVKHTAPIVAQRVPVFPGCVACAALAVLKAKPVDNFNDKEEVEEPRPPCIVSFLINNKEKLVNEPALLHQGPGPARAAKQQTSIEFNRTEREGINPELARLYLTWQLKEGLLQFNTDFAVNPCFSLLVCLKRLRTPLPPLLVVDTPFSRPCCCDFPMLFRPALVKPIRQGHQVGRGANQPSCCQHHQNQPQADCCIQVHPPLSNPIAQRFTLHFEANSSQAIAVVLTILVYFALRSAQLACFHAVIVFATFVPWFFDQK
jgi:hypothetical protein